MATLDNSIEIDAPPDRVWAALTRLDALDAYDPGVKKATLLEGPREGVGARRHCDLAPTGWFRERVIDWVPDQSLAFELFECSLPVKSLTHRYAIVARGSRTIVRQRMEYHLKGGAFGRIMDALVVRRKWDAGIKGFFAGLKHHVESAPDR
ncbi:MAG TPA: SRPBCC family protein, partial [Vicinamibacterales bacterium]|nr:SRPBCC family protein [Vicinamibacterales bacterium]